MSYKSLLFCPDEKTARAVTQVLSELDFTVEPSAEPFAAVKKLTDEHFDALVVDIQNEQDASLLFKAARNSSQNHSSLAVAVVEGQIGVAKAFRIGANLVLTKPINVEQSKSTLRVARGLLRKAQVKPAASVASVQPAEVAPGQSETSSVFKNSLDAGPSFAPAASISSQPVAAAKVDTPFSSLEVEKDPIPVAEAADVAVLESLPELTRTTSPESSPRGPAEGTSAKASGQGTAVAPALEKPPVKLKAATAPMFTNEPIVRGVSLPDSLSDEEELSVPTFSSLEKPSAESGGAKKLVKIAALFLVCSVGGYWGWQKLNPMQYLSHRAAAEPEKVSATQSPEATQPQAAVVSAPSANQSVVLPQATNDSRAPVAAAPETSIVATPSHVVTQRNSAPENIEVQELPFSRDAKITVTPKPLVVKNGTSPASQKTAQLTAPTLDIPSESNSSAAVANLVSTATVLPKAGPSSVRVSQGVSQGLLLKKVSPAYPPMALQLHKEGAVDLLATISKSGEITRVKLLSGDPILARAASTAVSQWQYRPYLLNGEPVEIQTQITIVFKAPK